MSSTQLGDSMAAYVADLGVLDIKLHNLHWNVEGPDFFPLHAKLEEFYDQIGEDLDDVAERMLMVGRRPPASLKEFLAQARIEELKSESIQRGAILDQLIADFSHLLKESQAIVKTAEADNDPATADMFTGYVARYEKALWMLRAAKS